MGKHYLYRHVDNDIPIYIGIGVKPDKNFRQFNTEYHRAFSKRDRNIWWRRFIQKYGMPEVEILYECDSREEICEKEKEFIALYGRKDLQIGSLLNLIDGGEGNFGYITRPDTKEKLRITSTGKKRSPETIEKLRKAHLGRRPSPETTAKRIGQKRSLESREKMRNAHLGHKLSYETKRKLSIISKAVRLKKKNSFIDHKTQLKLF